MSIKKFLDPAVAALRERKNLVFFFVLTHMVFLFFGEWMVARGVPGVLGLRAEMLQEIQDLPYLKPLTGPLAGSLFLKITYTCLFNLIFGAFLTTTVTGLVFFIPYVMAVWRSFMIGVLFYGLDTSGVEEVVFYGTVVLEFGAYCLSSAVGTDIGLSILLPGRKKTASRMEAALLSLHQGLKLYRLVFLLLLAGAIWEISWLHYLGPFIKPDQTPLP